MLLIDLHIVSLLAEDDPIDFAVFLKGRDVVGIGLNDDVTSSLFAAEDVEGFGGEGWGDDAVADALEALTAEQIEQFRKYFNMFDKEKKGYIQAGQVGQILRTMGQAFEERDLKKLIRQYDSDGSGEIEFEEFAAMVANFVNDDEDKEALVEELREAFRLYDKEGNGYINVSDLRDILRALDDNVSEEELDEMIAEIDTDGSGTVDFDEFMEMMSGE